MPTPTYELIESVTLATTASSVTFSSITQSYSDLVLVANQLHGADGYTFLRFNGDATSSYSLVLMRGNGSSAFSSSTTTTQFEINQSAYTSFFNIVQIMGYSETDKNKSILSRGDNSAENAIAYAARWANNAAITSISVNAGGSSYISGSTFKIFGIAG
jgi:hypothetical protein